MFIIQKRQRIWRKNIQQILQSVNMNVLNYLRGKGTKIQVESPIRRSKLLSSAEQIYIQQIGNYIQIGGGYDVLKKKLFEDLNNNYMHDSPLVQQIVIILRKGLESRVRENQSRTIQIMEDLLSNCTPIMNQAFNNKKLCEALYWVCLQFRKLKSAARDQIRQKACGIFLYWHLKFKEEPNYVYTQFYERLHNQEAEFPSLPFIKQIVHKKQQQQKNSRNNDKLCTNNVTQIIEDCIKSIENAENLMKEQAHKIDTNFVRLLKAQNKKLYDISTSPSTQLSSQQKEKISGLYKKIRNILKQIQKINQTNTKTVALQKQKQFLNQKITPSKIQKEIPKLSMQPSPLKNKKSEGEQKKHIQLFQSYQSHQNKTQSVTEQQSILSKDLLDIDTHAGNQTNANTNQIENKIGMAKIPSKSEFQVQKFTTPKKKTEQLSQELLDLSNDYSTPNSTKQLNFKQLYSQNQISPELKGIDLSGSGKKIKEKQKIKQQDSDQAQFGEFN